MNNRTTLILVAASALAFALWLVYGNRASNKPPSEPSIPRESELEVDSAPTASTEHATEDPGRATRSTLEVQAWQALSEADVEDADSDEDSGAMARVIGRCIASESGLPLEGCQVKFHGFPRNSNAMALHGEAHWEDPEPVVTGVDGRFEIEFEAMPPYQHGLDISHPERYPRTARWGAFQAGQVEDFGDVPLLRGYSVHGRVVDPNGFPVSGVYVLLDNLPLPLPGDSAANASRGSRSAEDGVFKIETPLPPGTWPLDARADGWRLQSPASLTVSATRAVEPVTVVVKKTAMLSGICMDQDGDPVPGVRVRTRMRGSGRFSSDRTDSEGRFTLYAVTTDPQPVRLSTHGGGCEPVEDERYFEWGQSEIHLSLVRARSIDVTVLRAESRLPVEEFSVVCYPDQSNSSREREIRCAGHHSGGHVTIDNVWRGMNTLWILPKDPAWSVGGPVRFDASAVNQEAIVVLLDALAELDVMVSTASGEPVAGSEVEFIRHVAEDLPLFFVADIRSGKIPITSDPDRRWNEIVSRATTDSHGRATVMMPPDAERISLRVTGDHLPATVERIVPNQIKQPIRITLELGGRIEGTILFPPGFPEGAHVKLRRDDGQAIPNMDWDGVPVSNDGRFRAENLPAGSYQIHLSVPNRYQTDHGGRGGTITLSPQLGAAFVVDGAPTSETFNAEHFRPGELVGRVFLNDAPASQARVFLEMREGGQGRLGQYAPDSEGNFRVTGLLPGEYRVGLVVGDFMAREGEELKPRDSFRITPGGQVEQSFHFTR